jgi:hypothetical protein
MDIVYEASEVKQKLDIVTEGPVAVLSNGVVVANFSSPHKFNFEDGSVLEACDKELSQSLSLETVEETVEHYYGQGAHMVTLLFKMTECVLKRIDRMEREPGIDVILVPFPVLSCLREAGLLDRYRKVGTIRSANRQTKEASIDKFCR